MSATKTRRVEALLRDRYGIEDKQLAYEIVQAVLTPDDNAPRPRLQNHPAVIVARRVMAGCEIPPVMFSDIIAKLGEQPDEKRAADLYAAQARRGYAKAFYWLDDYAGTPRKPNPAQAPAAVYEWRE